MWTVFLRVLNTLGTKGIGSKKFIEWIELVPFSWNFANILKQNFHQLQRRFGQNHQPKESNPSCKSFAQSTKFVRNVIARIQSFLSGFNAISVVFGLIKNVNRVLEESNYTNAVFAENGKRLLWMVSYPFSKPILNFNYMTAFMSITSLRTMIID